MATGTVLIMTPAELAALDLVQAHHEQDSADSVRISACDVNVMVKSSSLQEATRATMAVAATPRTASDAVPFVARGLVA